MTVGVSDKVISVSCEHTKRTVGEGDNLRFARLADR